MAEYHLTSPLNEEDVRKLKIGDTVYISGNVFTCRSRLQRYVFDEGNALPFDTSDRNILIHNGPIVIKEKKEKNKMKRIISALLLILISFGLNGLSIVVSETFADISSSTLKDCRISSASSLLLKSSISEDNSYCILVLSIMFIFLQK